MTQTIPDKWLATARQFEELERRMAEAGWFKQGWNMRWYYNNDQFGEGIGCQLAKGNWYNERENGIHFDAFARESSELNASLNVMLHIHDGFPKPAEFIRVFCAENAAWLENWENGKFMPNHPLMPLLVQVPYTPDTLAQELEAEYNRLRQLEPLIDKIIIEVLGQR
jgi:hypothetical protein